MKTIGIVLKSFQTKVTLAFIFSLLFVVGLAIILFYQYSLNSQFNQIREKLLVVARTASLAIDGDLLASVPLNKDGIKSEAYNVIARQLDKIKETDPSLKYVYTMTKTGQPGIWQFVVDPNPVLAKDNLRGPTAYPGDKYNVSRFPEMLAAYNYPNADNKLNVDEWGVTLSGYAPIYNRKGNVSGILGVDIYADSVYLMQKAVRLRVFLVLLIGIAISILLGSWVSRRVASSVRMLVEGTRKIAAGNLNYKVSVKGKDEIGELAASFNDMAASLSESRKKLEDYFYRVVQSLVRSLEIKDYYTKGHSDRVSEYAREIAREMGFSDEKAELLKKAAQLHDIGKVGIPEDILNKKEPLTDEEWEVIRKHPVAGEDILHPVFLDNEMLAVIMSHHERYDGKGYPEGLKGDQIDISAQIVAVADAYDAMTSSRAYRSALSKEEAINRIKKGSGGQFSPQVVDVFIKILERQG